MTTDSSFEAYREIVEDFHNSVKPKWSSGKADVKIIGDKWINEVKKKYKDDKLIIAAQDLLLSEVYRFSNTRPPDPIPYEQLALVMKGGGIKGLAYVGALEVLQDYYEFDWFSGTSAGAIAAILLGSGHDLDELNSILASKDFSDFKDANLFQRIKNFFLEKGFYKADTFIQWMDELLAVKLQSTTAVQLQDLPKRTTIYASRKDKGALIFDSFDEASKFKSASFAARCSMSIPYMFTPQYSEGLRVVDGGTQNNFPVEELMKLKKDSNFIGLYLGDEIYKHKPKSFLFKDLLSIWTESTDHELLRKYKDQIVVIDPSPISTMQFKLCPEEIEFLLEAGKLSAIKFLNKRSDFDQEDHDYKKRKGKLEEQRLFLKKKRRAKRIWFRIKLYILLFTVFSLVCLLAFGIGSFMWALILHLISFF